MTAERKDEHVRIAEELRDERSPVERTDFDFVRFEHRAFGGLRRDKVSTAVSPFDAPWSVPFYVNAMTGGTDMTGRINRGLGEAAAAAGVPLATGSLSPALRDPATAGSFTVIREVNPAGFVFANVGAGTAVDGARRAVDLLHADALQIHVNAAQELVMPEGDRDFSDWLDGIGHVVAAVDVPVVVKEVGFGLSAGSIHELADVGVRWVDVSGRGGTNFVAIENRRRLHGEYGYLAGWGQSAVECLLDADREPHPRVTLLASGGVRTPLDVVRALALGAKAVGVSGHFLHTLLDRGVDALVDEFAAWHEQIGTIMTLLGAQTVTDLRRTDVLLGGPLLEFCAARGIDPTAYGLRSEA